MPDSPILREEAAKAFRLALGTSGPGRLLLIDESAQGRAVAQGLGLVDCSTAAVIGHGPSAPFDPVGSGRAVPTA